jgi:hypothetical protein
MVAIGYGAQKSGASKGAAVVGVAGTPLRAPIAGYHCG